MRMSKKSLSTAILTGAALLLTAGLASAQSVVNLTALRQNAVTPDGNIVPMWGWLCGNGVAGATGTGAVATPATTTCTQTNGQAQSVPTGAAATGPSTVWQPILIRVPYTSSAGVSTTGLTINLSNNLPVPTSLTIVGQLPNAADPNGAGHPARETTRGQHVPQTATTWTTVVTNQLPFTPPSQGPRAQAFVQEAAAAVAGGAAGSISYSWTALTPGTYLIESGSYPSIQGPMGLYGVLVVAAAPVAPSTASTAYSVTTKTATTAGVTYDADAVMLLSEVDAVQNQAADTAARTPGFNPTTPWSPACSPTGSKNPSVTSAPNTCYPPAVDYTPTYYFINGHGFDRSNPAFSAVTIGTPTAVTDTTGTLLVRFVNAGLRMHMPSIVGTQMALIAEDGHLQPDVAVALVNGVANTTCPSGNVPVNGACPKVQDAWFMAAGKVLDIAINPSGTLASAYPASFTSTFDRSLALSNNNQRDGGMQAYLVINGGAAVLTNGVQTGFGAAGLGFPGATAAQANNDTFTLPAHAAATNVLVGNVLVNDVGISNVGVVGTALAGVVLNPNGMLTYTGNAGGSFQYCGNGATSFAPPLCATVTIKTTTPSAAPTAIAQTYTSVVNTLYNQSQPGVLTGVADPSGYAVFASTSATAVTEGSPAGVTGGCTVVLQSNGSFTASRLRSAAAATCTFPYYVVNSQGSASASAVVTVNFLAPSNLNVGVQDATSGVAMSDYKWVIEQDLTFKIDPACQINNGPGAAAPLGSDGHPCPTVTSGIPPTLGTNFHTSYMPVIASGCTGPQSCERGQSVYDPTTGTHILAACNHGVCLQNATGFLPTSLPGDVQLNQFDPDGKTPARYYLSILPGDAANPFNVSANGYLGAYTQPGCEQATLSNPTTPTGQQVPVCGHTMSGANIPAPTHCVAAVGATPAACDYTMQSITNLANVTTVSAYTGPGSTVTPLVINVQPNPLLTAQLAIFVFEDDAPLNGEHDVGGNNNEPGLGGFQAILWDEMAQSGDFTGQMTYDIFNMPLSNSLNGTIDPLTGLNACPVAATGPDTQGNTNQTAAGVIILCPQYESDGVTPSPLVGNALVKNLMPGRFGVIVHPSAAREAAGEVWYQTNTLDGTHFLDSFVKVGEPAYFQEYGPGGWHVFMGMANPAVINARKPAFCNGPPAVYCGNTVKGQVSNLHENRAPDETLYDSGVMPMGDPINYQSLAHTTCWASLGDPDGLTFAFTNCDANGNFSFTGIPDGNWALTVGDQWNDLIIDGSSKPVNLCSNPAAGACKTKTSSPYMVDSPTFSWQTHVWTSTFMDLNGNGIQEANEPGLIQVPTRIRFRNGRFNNTQLTDVTGHANFNETFPLFNWYVVETDDTRFKNTGVHVVYDFGGQIDGPTGTTCLGAIGAGGATAAGSGGSAGQANSQTSPCGNGNSGAYVGILNSKEPAAVALPAALRYPGSYYCTSADCSELKGTVGFPGGAAKSTTGGPSNGGTGFPTAATGTGGSTGRVDPGTVVMEGLQGFLSQTEILEWGKLPYLPGETGGIRGHVVYASTRPFDDPMILSQNIWEPLVPNVTMNLYQETAQPDGSTGLTLIDTTQTSSWDKYAQGFRTLNANNTNNVPNLNCPGQPTTDPFFNYTLAGTANYLSPNGALPNNSQFKCYDSMHNFNQVQPAPYDGLYQFPSANCVKSAAAGAPGCVVNPNFGQVASAQYVLPAAKYVVEVVVPPGYELVKEEDKNILIGDAFLAPAVVSPQFAGLSDIFIVPDQASINQNNINGVYNPAIYSGQNNPSYTGPITSGVNPYQACVSGTSCAPNGNNSQPTTTMGRNEFGGMNAGGILTMNAPCVGEVRVVPDFMSISPESGQVSPFAGSSRPLCDRKEITLDDQMQAQTDFFVWTKTPGATHFTGFILDDMSSEFDQASPSFGEKFAVPNLPVAIRDFNGVEVSRTYSDQWGLYNGLLFSTWEVNPPNPTGYSPGMYITEMNSPGPILAPVCITNATATTAGFPAGCLPACAAGLSPPNCQTVATAALPNQQATVRVNDPYWNKGYSTFDYENPFMPADTTYLDTPVIPTQAFAEAYNPPDCDYPDTTPAIKSVTGDSIKLNPASGPATGTLAGPWVSAVGNNITITALGDQIENNNAYSGPLAIKAPFNQRTITRHYGFGAAVGTVTIGGVVAPVSPANWTDTQITVAVPSFTAQNPMNCTLAQTSIAAANQAHCGQLVITAANGKRSLDAVTITIGGKAPTYIAGEKINGNTFGNTLYGNSIQTAIDNASPGDMIIVGPGTYAETVLMWKPVRLQGVAAASTIINANAQPAGKLDAWRRQVNCLFGLGLNGQQIGALVNGAANPYDATGQYSCDPVKFSSTNGPNAGQAAVDPIMLEPIIGWDATLNGNLSEMLQEPTLMGAYEGAAITVLAKGLENNEFSSTGTTCSAEGNAGCISLNSCPVSVDANGRCDPQQANGTTRKFGDCNPNNPVKQYFTANFLCNPSRVDGLTLTNSSQGGGALFIHGWDHHLEISNNRITGNAGTLTGGITLGQAEVPDPTYVTVGVGAHAVTTATPLAIDTFVNMHNNAITFNMSYGDELNSNTPAAGGGITVNTGSDHYTFANNLVCGNLSTGDGGGMTHFGLTFGGVIQHNAFLFNQSTNPTLTTNGGGLIIEGNAPDGTLAENSLIDLDAGPSLSDGSGSVLVDGNLIMGNTAESGEGGGLRIQTVNGNDILNNPSNSGPWYKVTVTNNVIANNVAGWEGGGVSIQDAVRVDFRNNTVVSNDTTATAGVLFDTLGAQLANTPPPGCNPTTGVGCGNAAVTSSTYMPAGLVTHPHSLLLIPAFTDPGVMCPDNGSGAGYANHDCKKVSKPALNNDIIFGNRTFFMSTSGSPSVVVLVPGLSQSATPSTSGGVVTGGTGSCTSSGNGRAVYWDIGVYGDTNASGTAPNHASGFQLSPRYNILTSLSGGYASNGNLAGPAGGTNLFASMYCNGSRVPPEISSTLCVVPAAGLPPAGPAGAPGCTYPGALGITVPPGVADGNPFYGNLTLTPAATVDEGNNWVNMFYGPLTTVNPTIARGALGYNAPLGDYRPNSAGSPAVGKVPCTQAPPATDFFGNARFAGACLLNTDIGAIQQATAPAGRTFPTQP